MLQISNAAMETLKIEVICGYNNRAKRNGLLPIHIKLRKKNNSFRKLVYTGVDIAPNEWQGQPPQYVNTRNSNHAAINKLIADIVTGIQTLDYRLVNDGKEITGAMIDNFLSGKTQAAESFTDFYYNNIEPETWKQGTIKEHTYTLKILQEFQPNILFSDLTLDFVERFDRWLRTEKKLKQNTIYKHHKNVQRFITLAQRKEAYNGKNPYANFKSKKEKGTRLNLTGEELKTLENIKLDADRQANTYNIWQMFLFSCYTGLRFSDVVTLTRADVLHNADGSCYIVKKMEKVPKPVTLPVDLLFGGKPRAILDRFLAHDNGGTIFPQYSNQFVNRELKMLAARAQITMNLTFHIARHTFGTMLAELTQNPYLIMDLMGHESIITSMIYIHSSQERINRQLMSVKWE